MLKHWLITYYNVDLTSRESLLKYITKNLHCNTCWSNFICLCINVNLGKTEYNVLISNIVFLNIFKFITLKGEPFETSKDLTPRKLP